MLNQVPMRDKFSKTNQSLFNAKKKKSLLKTNKTQINHRTLIEKQTFIYLKRVKRVGL